MIVYNITIKIVPEIETEWVTWQQQEHIPDVMASHRFTGYSFYKLLEQDEEDGITYVVQYVAASLADYEHYIQNTAPLLRNKAQERWGNRFIAFRTVMEAVH